jgi:hypothetical protein
MKGHQHMIKRETMWADMKPDCYGGKSCEQIVPKWSCYAEGDKDGEGGVALLSYHPILFPPGTKIVVSQPVCPTCNEVPSRSMNPVEITGEGGDKWQEYKWSCDCDFDWREWAIDQYS